MWKLGLGTLFVVMSHAHAGVVQLSELPGHVTEGRVVIDATPQQIYDVVTAYAAWPQVFTDVISVTVEGGGRENAIVTFRSRAVGREGTIEFDNDPGRSISFRGIKGPPGGRSSGHYALIPLDDGKRTQVIAKLYMDVVGAPGLVVREKKVRAIREAKLKADLTDMAAFFDKRAR